MSDKSNVSVRLGEQLKILRENRGLTMAEAGSILGKDRSYVSRIESGASTTLERFEEFLNLYDGRLGIIDGSSDALHPVLYKRVAKKEMNVEALLRSIADAAGYKITLEEK